MCTFIYFGWKYRLEVKCIFKKARVKVFFGVDPIVQQL